MKKPFVVFFISLAAFAFCAFGFGAYCVQTYWTSYRTIDVAYEVTGGHGPVAVEIRYPKPFRGTVSTPFRITLSGQVSDSTILYGIAVTANNPAPNDSAPDIVVKVVANGREVCNARGKSKAVCPADGGAGGARV